MAFQRYQLINLHTLEGKNDLPVDFVTFVLWLMTVILWMKLVQARKHILEIHTRDWNPKLAELFVEELAEKCVGKSYV